VFKIARSTTSLGYWWNIIISPACTTSIMVMENVAITSKSTDSTLKLYVHIVAHLKRRILWFCLRLLVSIQFVDQCLCSSLHKYESVIYIFLLSLLKYLSEFDLWTHVDIYWYRTYEEAHLILIFHVFYITCGYTVR